LRPIQSVLTKKKGVLVEFTEKPFNGRNVKSAFVRFGEEQEVDPTPLSVRSLKPIECKQPRLSDYEHLAQLCFRNREQIRQFRESPHLSSDVFGPTEVPAAEAKLRSFGIDGQLQPSATSSVLRLSTRVHKWYDHLVFLDSAARVPYSCYLSSVWD
jgi:hypothetical protein